MVRWNEEIERSADNSRNSCRVQQTNEWDKFIPLIQLALNDQISAHTKSSAFELLFGRKRNGFADFSATEPTKDWATATIRQKEKADMLSKAIWPALSELMSEIQTNQRKQMDERPQLPTISVGDRVMAVDQTHSSKWDPKYEGPFTVAICHPGGTYTLTDATGQTISSRRSAEHLKFNTTTTKINGNDQRVKYVFR